MPELNWQGKYDDNGQIVGPLRVALPFQTVETVNQSAQERQKALWATASGAGGRNPGWRNRLIWGDKKYVLPSLLDEFAGQVDLIYIDPPFATGADFGYKTAIHPADDDSARDLKLEYQPNLIEQIAYRDTWGGGLDTYLGWMYETLTLLRELLAESGSIYVHCDWRTSHYIKAMMDGMFNYDNFVNEVIWCYRGMPSKAQKYQSKHDAILFYSKGGNYAFNVLQGRPTEGSLKTYESAMRVGYNANHSRMMVTIFDEEKYRAAVAEGKIPSGMRETYFDGGSPPLSDWWDDIKILGGPYNQERLGFETQKPWALLDRIISASSNPGDLVLDCFAGSGTTAAVAEKLGRRWIAADMGRFAISTTRKRLLGIPNVKPFYVQNLGHYERQQWQSAETEQNYREFILQLYRAEPVSGYQWLHGAKAGRMVHIGAVDAPVAIDDVRRIVDEFGGVIGSGVGAPTTAGVDVLGWDFGLEVDTAARELADRAGVGIRLLRIPREVMDAKAVDAGDIHFFELAALTVDCKVNRRRHSVALALQDFTMPLDGVPSQVKDAVQHWSQWIDYWAADWDYQNDTFNNQWQSYRTRQDPQLQRAITHTYESRGQHTVVVKVIDILGNDTTRRLEVSV